MSPEEMTELREFHSAAMIGTPPADRFAVMPTETGKVFLMFRSLTAPQIAVSGMLDQSEVYRLLGELASAVDTINRRKGGR